jgi:hypothetical protein
MADIAQHLPTDSQTIEAIYAAYKKAGDSEQPRGYLGASLIGHSCERYLWYTFRYCYRPEFSGRMYRLFETGDFEEARFVSDLRSIGCEVHERDEAGNQFAVSALGGHFSGHMDSGILGVIEAPKTWHVGEFKTHNAKSFAKLKKEGVKKAKPQHYAQMMVYMGLSGMTRALYLARNKDTDELYSERVRFDKAEFDSLMGRAERIIKATEPPARISNRPDYYECGYCDAKEICWGSARSALPIPAISCRQCCHSTPTMDGEARWTCEKHARGLSVSDQSRGCDDHLVLPGLISFAEPVDYGDYCGSQCITFQNLESIEKWIHGKGNGAFGTKELMALSRSDLTNPLVESAKELLGATVTGASTSILARYPEADTRIVWRGNQKELLANWLLVYQKDMKSETILAKEDNVINRVAEFEGGRIAIIWTTIQEPADGAWFDAEIREGVS